MLHNSDRNLGGRDLDWKILVALATEFSQRNPAQRNPQNDKKYRYIMLQAIEKMRKALSGDDEATIRIENLISSLDLERTMTRDQFQELIADKIEQL